MKFSLRRLAEFLELPGGADAEVTGWSVDSRTLEPGDLFFALRGPNHNGHDYIAEVFRKGAVAVVMDQEIFAGEAPPGRVLRVENALQGLQRLARRARQSWGGRVVAVTGSAGKTTTKDIIAEMLAEAVPTAKSQGNLNNQVGLPLSVLRLDENARVAVLEMGMNHAGEIRTLAGVAQPDTGVVTNVGWAHIEEFDSIEGIAAAKRELIESLPAEGIAVLNADDPRVSAWRAGFSTQRPARDWALTGIPDSPPRRAALCAESVESPRGTLVPPPAGEAKASREVLAVLYGQSPNADVRADDVEYSADGVKFRVGGATFESPLLGPHGVSNLLAGIAVAGIYGIAPNRLRERVAKIFPAKMRGERFHCRGVLVYNDCYNSNPDAARAMLDVLRDTPANRRIAVLGEMLELGHWAETLHRDVGSYAAGSGINVLVGIRGAAWHTLDAAKRAGLRADAAFFFEDPVEAGRLLRSLAEPGDAILFKGSRGVQVEKALQEFVGRPREHGEEEGVNR